jgi:Ca-activated chloride channel family protein
MLRSAFANPGLLWALLALPALALLGVWATRRRRQALARLGSGPAVRALLTTRSWPRRLRGLLTGLGLLLLGVGAAGPRWGRDWDQTAAPGRDLVVVVDCSCSMLAEAPARLTRAREMLDDLAAEVRRRPGHRLALVAFAGRPLLICPLTHDYDHFAEALGKLAALPGGPELAPLPPLPGETSSGTRIGLGLHEALLALDERSHGAADVLLLSDGDDPVRDDAEWAYGADECQGVGVPVHVVGIGDPNRDYAVPGRDGAMTRLEEGPLRDIVRRTGGQYFPAHTRPFALGRAYLALIANRPLREESADALPVYQQRSRWFLLPALLLLAAALVVPDGAARRAPPPPPASPRPEGGPNVMSRPRAAVTATAALSLLLLAAAPEQGPEALLRQGHAAFDRGDYAAAADLFDRALQRAPDPAPAAFALAAVKYRLAVEGPVKTRRQTLCEAEDLFRAVLDRPGPRRAAALYGVANCLLLRAELEDAGASVADALACYRLALADGGLTDDLADDARHNLERGRLLALQLPSAGGPAQRPPPDEGNHRKPEEKRPEPKPDEKKNQPKPEEKGGDGQAGQRVEKGPAPGDHKGAQATDEAPPPGAGLPGIPDTGEAVPLPADAAAEHLKLAARRVEEERQANRRRSMRSAPDGVKDW